MALAKTLKTALVAALGLAHLSYAQDMAGEPVVDGSGSDSGSDSSGDGDLQIPDYECKTDTWQNATQCGFPCKAYVTAAEEYHTCNEYCAGQEHGLTCVAAYEDLEDDCTQDQYGDYGCDFDFKEEGSRDMICLCTSEVFETDKCNTSDWDWNGPTTYVKKYCGSCKVLTASTDQYFSCDYFCAYQGPHGYECKGAWASYSNFYSTEEDSCGVAYEVTCETDFSVLELDEMICECNHRKEPDTAKLFGQASVMQAVAPERKKYKGLLAMGILFSLLSVGLAGVALYKFLEANKDKDQDKPVGSPMRTGDKAKLDKSAYKGVPDGQEGKDGTGEADSDSDDDDDDTEEVAPPAPNAV
eukprot:g56493.t1